MTSPSSTGAAGNPPPPGGGAASGPARPVAVAVIDRDQRTRAGIGLELGQGANPLESIGDLLPRLQGQPVVVVLGPSFAEDDELRTVANLLATHREVGAIMVTNELTTDILQQRAAGGREGRAAGTGRRPPTGRGRPAGGHRAGHARPPRPPCPSSSRRGSTAGSSPCSPPRAGPASRSWPPTWRCSSPSAASKPVVLIDADLQFGDIAVMLKLAPQHTIVDAVGAISDPDRRRRLAAPEPARPGMGRPVCWCCRRRSSRPSPTRSAPRRWCGHRRDAALASARS